MSMLTGGQIPLFRLKVLLKGMELEGEGIKISRGRSALTIVKKEFGWKGNRKKIIALLEKKIIELEEAFD